MIIDELDGNIIDYIGKHWIAHCISLDCKMGCGVALTISNRLPCMRKELVKYVRQYSICTVPQILPCDQYMVINLVTKREYYNKPTYKNIYLCLIELSIYCINHNISEIYLPRIGCGVDGKKWKKVKSFITDIFSDIEIAVHIIQYNIREEF